MEEAIATLRAAAESRDVTRMQGGIVALNAAMRSILPPDLYEERKYDPDKVIQTPRPSPTGLLDFVRPAIARTTSTSP